MHIEAVSTIIETINYFPVKCVFTTNYDNLIEECLKKHKRIPKIKQGLDFNAFSEYFNTKKEEIPIFKLAGDISNGDDITDYVVGYKDSNININEKDKESFLTTMAFLIPQYPILYIGYSLQDGFTEILFKKVNSIAENNNVFC